MNDGTTGSSRLAWWLLIAAIFFSTDLGKYILKSLLYLVHKVIQTTVSSGIIFLVGAIIYKIM